MKNKFYIKIEVILCIICVLALSACITPKDTLVSRKLQNLTAKYNYIYNANLLLDEHENRLEQTYKYDYQNILPVYLDPAPEKELVFRPDQPNKLLDGLIDKAHAIINQKNYSDYLDDSYILLGKANYLKGNYFVSAAYFDYAYKAFAENKKTVVSALNWKARSQIQLNNLATADKILDTLNLVTADYKKNLSEFYATTAQLKIYQHKYNEATVLLQRAIRNTNNRLQKIRWRFILAQLQQEQNNQQDALKNYTKVQRSNGPFEMYFHANLQRIRIETQLSGKQIDEEKELLKLIKDDKNFDYIDQVYGQIGELFAQKGNFRKAEFYFKKSAKNSSNNINQKALSYLSVANLNFKELKNYREAKLYYDTTMLFLPTTFPGYNNIAKTAINLQYLTDRYASIDLQDTLQAIAKLPVDDRQERVHQFAKQNVDTIQTAQKNNITQTQAPNNVFQQAGTEILDQNIGNGSTLYFNNPAALSKGFSDFKIRWGNRVLQDNWRQSTQSSAQQNNQILTGGNLVTAAKTPTDSSQTNVSNLKEVEKEYLAALPITESQLLESNQKIIDAYYQIANFYQQELNDKAEAEKVFAVLLGRFPTNSHQAAILYTLYLNNQNNTQKATGYKDEIIKLFPSSEYAKIVGDPLYSSRKDGQLDSAYKKYDVVYQDYFSKDYANLISNVDNYLKKPSADSIDAQFAYLKAISVGRTAKVNALIENFESIIKNYPEDKIVVPLVKSQLAYVNNHMEDFSQRKVALVDFNENDLDYLTASLSEKTNSGKASNSIKISNSATVTELENINVKIVKVFPKELRDSADVTLTAKKVSIFSTAISSEYYYVIDVKDASLTLSSSRFGIGQFNRGNYPDNDLVHKLIELDEDQLIYINAFVDLEDAKIYENSIKGQLDKIMKVPSGKYQSFIISKENFEKLLDRKLIERYLEFYKDNY